MPRNPDKRPRLAVTHDSDGGLTIRDPQSDLVVSIIATHPLANGPRGLFVEVYCYTGGPVPWQDATRPVCACEHPHALCTPDHHRDDAPPRHPTIAFYAPAEGD